MGNLFGEKTWLDVRERVNRFLMKRYPTLSSDERADVLSEVMVDLIGYWQGLSSSTTDDVQRNFAYACQRGRWSAVAEVNKLFRHNHVEVLAPACADDEISDDDKHFVHAQSRSIAPDEIVVDDDLSERARYALAQLPEEELRDWFDHLLTGESQRDCARKLGISRNAFICRQRVRRSRMMSYAEACGLVD